MAGGVFVMALVLRVLFWWGQADGNPFFGDPFMDELKHHEWAQGVAAGAGMGDAPFFRAPLYSVLLGLLYVVLGPDIALARLAGCVLGAASCVLIALLGRQLGNLRVGWIAGVMAAVYWPFIYFDAQLLSVGLENFLNLSMLGLLLWAAQRDRPGLFLAGGLAWGLSAITRPTTLLFAPALVLWLWLVTRRAIEIEGGATRPAWRAWRPAALVFAGAALAILPVTIRNRAVSGEWVLIASNGGVAFYCGNNPLADGVAALVPGTRGTWDGGYADTHRIVEAALGRAPTEGEVSRYWYAKAWTWILDEPLAWAGLLARKARLAFSHQELSNNAPIVFFAELSPVSSMFWIGFPVIAPLAVAGLATVGRRWRQWALPGLFGASVLLAVVVFYAPARYRLPAVPVMILLAAGGLDRLPELSRTWRRAVGLYALLGTATLAFVLTNPPPAREYRRQEAGQGHFSLGLHFHGLASERPEARSIAARHFTEAMRLRPDDFLMAKSVAPLLLQLGYPAEADRLIDEIAPSASGDAAILHFRAEYLCMRGRFDEAARECERALELDPASEPARGLLGAVLVHLGRLDEAMVHLERAIELGQDPVTTWHEVALTLAARGNDELALRYFDRVLELDPAHEAALSESAAARARLGRGAEARAR